MKKNTTKADYRIRNWAEYNRALVARGSISLWIAPDVEKTWFATPDGSIGRPQFYSDAAMTVMAIVRVVYHLPLRGVQGFIASLFAQLRIDIPVPNYTTVARRLGRLEVDLGAVPAKGPVHIVIDSTGIKVFGEGEWKVRKHGASKRRTWRKLHIAVDARSHQTLGVVVTENDVNDCEVLDELLAQIPDPVASIAADGAYDTEWNRYLCAELGARALIPPRVNARAWPETGNGAAERNRDLARIAEIGRKAWKVEVGYHMRSLVETQMFRQKTIFGERVRSRSDASQVNELRLRTRALNMMTSLGMPDSYAMMKPGESINVN